MCGAGISPPPPAARCPRPGTNCPARRAWSGSRNIVGYTTTTRHAGIDELAALLEAFEKDATETIATYRGRVVKTVGDEVLFVTDAAGPTRPEIALRPRRSGRGADQGLPMLRVGMAMGPVLSRVRRCVRLGGEPGRPADRVGPARHRAVWTRNWPTRCAPPISCVPVGRWRSAGITTCVRGPYVAPGRPFFRYGPGIVS